MFAGERVVSEVVSVVSLDRQVRRLVVCGLVVGAMLPDAVSAQRRGANDRLLIMTPIPATGVDTAFAIEAADALRERMASRYRARFGVIPTATICEALEASGFDCSHPLPPDNAPALARFLQSTAFMVGWLDRHEDSLRLRLRMVDVAGSGLSGWQTFMAPLDETPRDFGRDVADDLDDAVRAARYAQECQERRQRGDGEGAADRADRAFGLSPNHPSAAMCLAFAYEVEQAPIDSIVSALQLAVAGDSMLGSAWAELGRRLRDKGDTAAALDAFRNQLRADPTDPRLRLGVAAGLVTRGDYEAAIEVLDGGLALNPGDAALLQVKERACLDGELWECGLEALEARYELDTTLASDTIFFQKAFGAAQSIPDTAAMLRWSELGVTQFPSYVAAWRARAATLKDVDDREGAIAAYERIIELDSTQVGSALAAGQYLLDSTLVIDTTVPLDTARLLKAERMLTLAGRQISDTATSMAIATLFYNPASRIAQLRLMPHLPLATRFLEHALELDLRGQLDGPANFFLGLSLFFQVTELDAQVRESEDCEMVDVELEMAQRAKAALEIGRPISEQTVNQLLGFVDQILGALPTYKPAFGCPGA
jgi:tetratricopeptide (TPR) repeat protein